MRRSVVPWSVGVVVVLGGAGLGYLYLSGGSGEPSTELTTPTLPSTGTTTEGELTFIIDPTMTVASFEVDEVLFGSPNHVVGETSQVAGQVRLDSTDLSTLQFSQIVINARTLKTDEEERDQSIRTPIMLNSGDDRFEFITFEVNKVEGLSGSLEVGEQVEFTVTGDLTIKETTREVSFAVTATLVDPDTVKGLATTQVLRTDFGIDIPSVEFVANVSDEVLLNLRFVARAG